jgi:large subunit ribosomal protein L4
MVKVPVYNAEGKQVRKADFDESVFGEKVLTKTLQGVVLGYARNLRQGNAHSKTRGDVAGANRKLWKQKGTGKARVGDRRSPTRGGGVAHGPKSRDWVRPIPKKLRHAALYSALLSKFKDGEVCVVEGMAFADGPKTRRVASFLSATETPANSLFAVLNYDENFLKSVRNLPRTELREFRELNAYEVMKARRLVLSSEAFAFLQQATAEQGA